MRDRTGMLKATLLAAPLGALVFAAQTAGAGSTLQKHGVIAPTPAQAAGVPSSPHQEQVMRGEQGGEQQGGQQLSTGQPQLRAQGSGMPSTPHQEQLLRRQQGAGQPGTAAQGSDMPSTPHQEQLLRGQQGGEQ